MYEIRYLGEY